MWYFLLILFPFFCWFCFSYRHYYIQIYVKPIAFVLEVSCLRSSNCTYTSHPMYISSICDKCDISYWFFFLSFVDFVLVIVTTIFKFMSSLLHSSSRCPVWEVVTVHIHRIICTFLLFVINVMFLIDFFPYFCWFCFSYRQYDIQNYVHR